MSSTPLLHKGAKFVGEYGRTYLLTWPLVHRIGMNPNVWKAFDVNDPKCQYVIKGPRQMSKQNWVDFEREIKMQRYFDSVRYIRRMLDVISHPDHTHPLMVLEPFQKTLWMARMTRPLSTREIKHIMKLTLLGLNEIHEKGLVHCDFKGENVLLNGFDDDHPASDENKKPVNVQVKVSDLGTVMPPSEGKITSITYRSPEAYLGKPWTSATDIWSWSILFFHLLQAQRDFDSPGIYDSIISSGTRQDKADAVLAAMCDDFDLRSIDYFQDCALPPPRAERTHKLHWRDRLLATGVPKEDIEFLSAIIQPDPRKRLTVAQILGTKYLDVD
ncbi:hypothetical protein VTO42DRAFT_5877 [Malbranchea cinnamomea]